MSRGVNKVILIQQYVDGSSLPELSEVHGIPVSTIRSWLIRAEASCAA